MPYQSDKGQQNEYFTLCGFTQHELETVFKDGIDALANIIYQCFSYTEATLIIHMYHHTVISDAITVEHTGGFKVAVPAVDDDTIVVKVVDNAAMGAGGTSVVADTKTVTCSVTVRTREIVATIAVAVGRKVGRAYDESSKTKIKTAR